MIIPRCRSISEFNFWSAQCEVRIVFNDPFNTHKYVTATTFICAHQHHMSSHQLNAHSKKPHPLMMICPHEKWNSSYRREWAVWRLKWTTTHAPFLKCQNEMFLLRTSHSIRLRRTISKRKYSKRFHTRWAGQIICNLIIVVVFRTRTSPTIFLQFSAMVSNLIEIENK